MHDQVRQVVEASTIDDEGMASSRIGHLRHSAPQLLGLLRAWPDIVGPSFVRIPSDLFALIDAPWSLVPTTSRKEDYRQAVGDRAEAYSFYLLRLESGHPNSVVWASRDDQGLGYDIEDRSGGAVHRVEVKGSQNGDVRFYLSAHEHEVAHQDPSRYEIHFWGDISLNRSPSVEFTMLRERGFPLRFEGSSCSFGRRQALGEADHVPSYAWLGHLERISKLCSCNTKTGDNQHSLVGGRF